MNKSEAEDFAARIAGPDPCSGGGSVVAHAGSLAAALGEMMAGLTEGREKFAGQDSRIRKIHQELADARGMLKDLVQKDSSAFRSLMDAMRMPKSAVEEKAVRAEAIERAIQHATETPLWTARAVFEVLERLRILIEIGNPNARCDVAVGSQLAFASIKGAYYNILVNTSGLKNRTFAESCRSEAGSLVKKAQEILLQIDFLIEGS
jgi:formiminotetrahydrofolate cyclodeaminase